MTAQPTTRPAETQRDRRGHNFYPPKSVLKKIPALYATDGTTPLAEKTIHLHYFGGPYDAWIAEFDPETGMAFGYVEIGGHGEGEWGSVYLPEVEELNLQRGLIVIERDLYWEPVPFSQALR